ncbi:Na+/H+ antiporter NhaC [uncultured Fusobacterium sp.]|jgi:NhaC family Na+:H+ antiporter|uniref:Na+/H+ antiporter NhaC n=1 Tax=uncultured Fusobacterium sp. TaxID=159267 RepID=UPI0015A6B7DB|nr:Na+/H+ antiporter NhaC [uncultured Fusobacterium sp.]
MSESSKVRLPNKVEAIIPIVFLLTVMITNYALGWGLDPHIPVTLSCGVAMIIGKLCGYSYKDMLAAGLEAVNQSLEAIIIILLVGCLIGSFTACGTIPAVVYYGLKLLTPAIFLPFVTTLCAVVGIALGSAWTVTATLGIAFMAIGTTMGLNPALIAGAILSGACCGDKFSPLSDSTNLAAGSAQTGLFDHVAAMVTTTFPSLVLAVLLYTFFSLSKVGTYDPTLATELSSAILDHYTYMSPILLIPILLIVVVAVIKMPAIPSVVLLSLLGCVFAIIFQGTGMADCIKILHYGYEAESSNALFYKLVNRGGMDSMLWTNNLVIVAVAFGGILQKIGSVESLLGGLIKKVKTPFQLVLVTLATGVFCITTMCDQYLGLIIPASMYKDNYDEMGLGRNMLSRTLEDGGTLWSPLVPWSSCGAYHAAVLGVPTLAYLPYCFMNIINPIYAIVTLSWGGNILYADGSRTNVFGKLKKGRGPAQAPEKAYEKAMKALARIRNSEGAKAL